MIAYENEMNKIIEALDDENLLNNCLISGSWAMFFYKTLFEDFIPPIATTDFDIFLPRVSKIKKANLNKILLDLDYLREDDTLTGKTRFYSKSGFEIEFLTLPDRSMKNVIKIPALNIGAEALPKLEPLTWNFISIKYNNHIVNVPSPSCFCLQKLLINKDRQEFKRQKDIDSIKYLLRYINASRAYKEEFIKLLNESPKKWKSIIISTMHDNGLDYILK